MHSKLESGSSAYLIHNPWMMFIPGLAVAPQGHNLPFEKRPFGTGAIDDELDKARALTDKNSKASAKTRWREEKREEDNSA
jgi:hypothetical protein